MKLFLFFLFVSLVPHNYHVSNTLVHQNTEAHTLEITIKIFVDDLKRLQENKEENSTEENYTFDTNEYILSCLKLSIDNDLLELKPLGREVENEMVYCYFEANDVFEISSFEVENTILFDLFEDQTNMVDVELPDLNARLLLNHEKSMEKVK